MFAAPGPGHATVAVGLWRPASLRARPAVHRRASISSIDGRLFGLRPSTSRTHTRTAAALDMASLLLRAGLAYTVQSPARSHTCGLCLGALARCRALSPR